LAAGRSSGGSHGWTRGWMVVLEVKAGLEEALVGAAAWVELEALVGAAAWVDKGAEARAAVDRCRTA